MKRFPFQKSLKINHFQVNGSALRYEGGIELSAKFEKGAWIEPVIVKNNGKVIHVPIEELRQVEYPILGNILLELPKDMGKQLVKISFRCNEKLYPWGTDSTEVNLVFSDEIFLYRDTRVPIDKSTSKLIRKKPGKDETTEGTLGAVKGIE